MKSVEIRGGKETSGRSRSVCPLLYRFLGQHGLLADTIRNFRQFPLVRADSREIIRLPNQVKGSQRFPYLVTGGVDRCELRTRCYVLAGLHERL